MSSPIDESESPRPGHKRLRIALIACFVAFCLAVCYVLLSAPLLLYSVHHWGSSTDQMVNRYMRPLLWADELLTPDYAVNGAEYKQPLHEKVLNRYYGLWESEVRAYYLNLQLSRRIESYLESMNESAPFLGADGPGSNNPLPP